eukprot:COSAG01_NODE_56_length_31088_cov_39.354771_15_plen_589_part_00
MQLLSTCSVQLLLLSTAALPPPPPPPGVVARTSLGAVVGQRLHLPTASGGLVPVQMWRGVPYAQPPVGAHRWRAPRAPLPFPGGTHRAVDWPPSCPNKLGAPSPLCRTCSTRSNPPLERNSEDCLYLNIMAPANASSSSSTALPVMLFVHGGGGVWGSGRAYAQSAALVERGVLLVTMNYRLGSLGFLAHELLSREQGGISGNYQLMDMVAALTWIRQHVRGFGGDPHQVSVFGQSFGGSAMHYLLLSPAAKGLFVGAISHSGGGVANYSTQADAQSGAGTALFSALNCTTLECARSRPWQAAMDAGTVHGPCVSPGRGWLPHQPLEAMRSGAVNRVPAIFGSNLVETHLGDYFSQSSYATFVSRYAQPGYIEHAFNQTLMHATGGGGACTSARCRTAYGTTLAEWTASALRLYGANATLLLRSPASAYERYSALASDAGAGLATFQWCQEWARSAPAYRYVFRQPATGSPSLAPFGAGHLVDLLFVFGRPQLIAPDHVMSADELATSARKVQLWTDFARHANPGPAWPAFGGGAHSVTLVGGVDGQLSAERSWRDAQYHFWAALHNYCGTVYPCVGSGAPAATRGRG